LSDFTGSCQFLSDFTGSCQFSNGSPARHGMPDASRMSYKLKNVPTNKWSISRTPQGTFLLVALNSVGQYEFTTEKALVQAADMLDPEMITSVISKELHLPEWT